MNMQTTSQKEKIAYECALCELAWITGIGVKRINNLSKAQDVNSNLICHEYNAYVCSSRALTRRHRAIGSIHRL